METSSIGWTDGSFNPWWGCERVSPACAHCYADTFAKRIGMRLWEAGGARRVFGEKHWNEPRRWNEKALARYGRRMRVFCASMADVFEDHPALEEQREKLWPLILETPNIDWQLLTKRPENVLNMVPWGEWPANVWIGASIENTRWTFRANILRRIPAAVRFISAEPLLGSLLEGFSPRSLDKIRDVAPLGPIRERAPLDLSGIHWLIAGGESGPKARRTELEWIVELVDAARAHGVAPFVKQLGSKLARDHGVKGKAEDPAEWPAALDAIKVQEFPQSRALAA